MKKNKFAPILSINAFSKENIEPNIKEIINRDTVRGKGTIETSQFSESLKTSYTTRQKNKQALTNNQANGNGFDNFNSNLIPTPKMSSPPQASDWGTKESLEIDLDFAVLKIPKGKSLATKNLRLEIQNGIPVLVARVPTTYFGVPVWTPTIEARNQNCAFVTNVLKQRIEDIKSRKWDGTLRIAYEGNPKSTFDSKIESLRVESIEFHNTTESPAGVSFILEKEYFNPDYLKNTHEFVGTNILTDSNNPQYPDSAFWARAALATGVAAGSIAIIGLTSPFMGPVYLAELKMMAVDTLIDAGVSTACDIAGDILMSYVNDMIKQAIADLVNQPGLKDIIEVFEFVQKSIDSVKKKMKNDPNFREQVQIYTNSPEALLNDVVLYMLDELKAIAVEELAKDTADHSSSAEYSQRKEEISKLIDDIYQDPYKLGDIVGYAALNAAGVSENHIKYTYNTAFNIFYGDTEEKFYNGVGDLTEAIIGPELKIVLDGVIKLNQLKEDDFKKLDKTQVIEIVVDYAIDESVVGNANREALLGLYSANTTEKAQNMAVKLLENNLPENDAENIKLGLFTAVALASIHKYTTVENVKNYLTKVLTVTIGEKSASAINVLSSEDSNQVLNGIGVLLEENADALFGEGSKATVQQVYGYYDGVNNLANATEEQFPEVLAGTVTDLLTEQLGVSAKPIGDIIEAAANDNTEKLQNSAAELLIANSDNLFGEGGKVAIETTLTVGDIVANAKDTNDVFKKIIQPSTFGIKDNGGNFEKLSQAVTLGTYSDVAASSYGILKENLDKGTQEELTNTEWVVDQVSNLQKLNKEQLIDAGLSAVEKIAANEQTGIGATNTQLVGDILTAKKFNIAADKLKELITANKETMEKHGISTKIPISLEEIQNSILGILNNVGDDIVGSDTMDVMKKIYVISQADEPLEALRNEVASQVIDYAKTSIGEDNYTAIKGLATDLYENRNNPAEAAKVALNFIANNSEAVVGKPAYEILSAAYELYQQGASLTLAKLQNEVSSMAKSYVDSELGEGIYHEIGKIYSEIKDNPTKAPEIILTNKKIVGEDVTATIKTVDKLYKMSSEKRFETIKNTIFVELEQLARSSVGANNYDLISGVITELKNPPDGKTSAQVALAMLEKHQESIIRKENIETIKSVSDVYGYLSNTTKAQMMKDIKAEIAFQATEAMKLAFGDDAEVVGESLYKLFDAKNKNDVLNWITVDLLTEEGAGIILGEDAKPFVDTVKEIDQTYKELSKIENLADLKQVAYEYAKTKLENYVTDPKIGIGMSKENFGKLIKEQSFKEFKAEALKQIQEALFKDKNIEEAYDEGKRIYNINDPNTRNNAILALAIQQAAGQHADEFKELVTKIEKPGTTTSDAIAIIGNDILKGYTGVDAKLIGEKLNEINEWRKNISDKSTTQAVGEALDFAADNLLSEKEKKYVEPMGITAEIIATMIDNLKEAKTRGASLVEKVTIVANALQKLTFDSETSQKLDNSLQTLQTAMATNDTIGTIWDIADKDPTAMANIGILENMGSLVAAAATMNVANLGFEPLKVAIGSVETVWPMKNVLWDSSEQLTFVKALELRKRLGLRAKIDDYTENCSIVMTEDGNLLIKERHTNKVLFQTDTAGSTMPDSKANQEYIRTVKVDGKDVIKKFKLVADNFNDALTTLRYKDGHLVLVPKPFSFAIIDMDNQMLKYNAHSGVAQWIAIEGVGMGFRMDPNPNENLKVAGDFAISFETAGSQGLKVTLVDIGSNWQELQNYRAAIWDKNHQDSPRIPSNSEHIAKYNFYRSPEDLANLSREKKRSETELNGDRLDERVKDGNIAFGARLEKDGVINIIKYKHIFDHSWFTYGEKTIMYSLYQRRIFDGAPGVNYAGPYKLAMNKYYVAILDANGNLAMIYPFVAARKTDKQKDRIEKERERLEEKLQK